MCSLQDLEEIKTKKQTTEDSWMSDNIYMMIYQWKHQVIKRTEINDNENSKYQIL